MADVNDFVSARARDAWATIRGYVYQVDTTLLRWLALADDASLHLELGEDIDHVSSVLNEPRELEQIKSTTAKLSLRSSAALEALANAVEHLHANPEANLTFRFTTTAQATHEAGRVGDVPGLELWEKARASGATDVRAIQEILSDARTPTRTPLDSWTRARAVFDDAEALGNLVRRFEWSSSAPAPEDLPRQVVQALAARGTSSLDEAEAQYQLLFVRVIRLLSTRGVKVLTRENLNAALSRGPLSASERALMRTMRECFALCDVRVAALERRLDDVGEAVRVIAAHVGIEPVIFDEMVEDGTPPPLVERLAPRTALVRDLASSQATWLALDGDAGIGKSHLAQLVARAAGGIAAWFRLPENADAAALLRRLARWADTPLTISNAAETIAGMQARTRGTIVVEDLPKLMKDSSLLRLLLSLATLPYPLALITTSWFSLPTIATQSARVAARICPYFDDGEATELFALYGGKDFSTAHPKAITSFNAMARMHPTLLSALAIELEKQHWALDAQAFLAVLAGEYAADTHGETLALLKRTTTPPGRELLLRVALARERFDRELVATVAQVSPSIARPLEEIESAGAIWLRASGRSRWRVSPLLEAAVDGAIEPQVAQACHREIAQLLLRKPMNPDLATSVVSHLARSGDVERALGTLAMLLRSLAEQETQIPSGLLLDLWWNHDLPPEVTVGSRLFLREAQRMAGVRYQKDVSWIDTEIDALIAAAEEDNTAQWAVAVALMARVQRDFVASPERAVVAFRGALEAGARARLPNDERFPNLSPILWVEAAHVRTRAQLRAWLEMLGAVPEAARTWPPGKNTSERRLCRFVCMRPWKAQLAREPTVRDWNEARDQTGLIIETARTLSMPYLEACALASMAAIAGEQGQSVDEVVAPALSFLAKQKGDPHIRVLMNELLGQRYFDASRYAEALAHFRIALDDALLEPDTAAITASFASRAAAQVQALTDTLTFAEQAVTLADAVPDPSEVEQIQARGELAIAHWLAGDRGGSARSLFDAAQILENQTRAQTREVVGATLTRGITAISAAARGGSEPPRRGFFFTDSAPPWQEAFRVNVAFQLCFLADAVGAVDDAKEWAKRVLDAETEIPEGMLPAIKLTLLPYALLYESEEAIERVALRSAECVEQIRARGTPIMPASLQVWLVTLPLAMALANQAVEDRVHARRIAERVAAALLALTQSPNDEWQRAAELMTRPHVDASSSAGLEVMANGATDEGWLRALCRVQATVAEDVPLRDALVLHFHLVPELLKLQAFGGERHVLLKWIERYWTTTLARRPFAFRSPQILSSDVAALTSLQPESRVRRTLGVIARGLDVRLPSDLRQWCAH